MLISRLKKYIIITIVSISLLYCAVVIILRLTMGSQAQLTKKEIAAISNAIAAYKNDVGRYPTSQEGLDALKTQPDKSSDWKGPYFVGELRDGWGHKFDYRYIEGNWHLVSPGQDGILDTNDDINTRVPE